MRRNRNGMALIVVLGTVAFLSLIGYTMFFSVRVHTRIAENAIAQSQARYLAAAAVEKSMALVLEDEIAEENGMLPWKDPSLFEQQTLGPGLFEVSFQDPLSETGRSFGLEDESAKVNLNTATREQLMRLPNMTDSLADCLIDWRDEDEQPSLFGAESETYLELEQPYSAKNKSLGTLRELLMVNGFDRTVLQGEDINSNGLVDANEDDGEETEPPDDADGILDEGILRYVTVYSADANEQSDGSPRVNLKSASAEELTRAMQGLTREQAEAIVAWRGQNEFQSIGNLLDVTRPSQQDPNNGQTQEGGNRRRGRGNPPPDQQAENPAQQSTKASGEKLFKAPDIAKWADAVTVSDEKVIPGLINLNTAPVEVLRTVEGLEEEDIAQIELMRGAETMAFKSVGDLLNVSSMNEEKFKRVVDKFTTRSNQFTVRATGVAPSGPSRQVVEAVIERTNGQARILYWREG